LAPVLHTLSLRLHLSLYLSHPPAAIRRATRETLQAAVQAASGGSSSRGWVGIVIAVLDSPDSFQGIVHPALPPLSVRSIAEVWVERSEEEKMRRELGLVGVEDELIEQAEEPLVLQPLTSTVPPVVAVPAPTIAVPAVASIAVAPPVAVAQPMATPAPEPAAVVLAPAPAATAEVVPALPFMSAPTTVQTQVITTSTTTTTAVVADDDDEPLPELDDASSDEDMEG
jgi:hypothetical protein